MKKLILLFSIAFGFTMNAQVCTPDSLSPSLASIGFPSLEWSGLWVNGAQPSFACDSTQPMMTLTATVGQPFEVILTGMLGDTMPSGTLLVPTIQSAFLYTTVLPSWLTWEAADSVFYPGDSGKTCIKLSGTPTLSDTTFYIPSLGIESGFFTSWYQVTGSMFGFPAIDTFGFCHNITVLKNTANLEDLPELSITLSPNPSKDFINVNLNQGVITEDLLSQIQVFNISGVALDVPIEATTSNDFNMNITKLPSGTYWLTLNTNRGKTREKFIVIK